MSRGIIAFGSSWAATWLGIILAVGCLSALLSASALGAAPAANWTINSYAGPTNFSEGDTAKCMASLHETSEPICDVYKVIVRNAGSADADGSTITLTDTLPEGLTVQKIEFHWPGFQPNYNIAPFGYCHAGASSVTCHLSTSEAELPPVAPDDVISMLVYVTVSPGASGSLTNVATVSGGGAPETSTSVQNQIGSTAPFGVTSLESFAAGLDGTFDPQAGDHPYEFTTRVDFAGAFRVVPDSNSGTGLTSVQDVKDVVMDLPLGFLGSALATPHCTVAQLSSGGAFGGVGEGGCPPDTAVGHIRTEPQGGRVAGATSVNGPLFNMVPQRGFAAQLGFYDGIKGTHAIYVSVVPTAKGYVLRATAPDIPQISLTSVEVTLYGNPAVKDGTGNAPVAFFTNSADCSGEPQVTSIHVDSWQNPGRYNADGTPDFSDPAWASNSSESPPVSGCNQLRFNPSLSVQPETAAADSPTGLNIDLKVPQSEEPGTLATPPLRDAAVRLPAGLTVNPAVAGGLTACSEAQIGWLGGSLTNFTPDVPSCPESSKVGTVELTTPLLEGTLSGSIYLAAQDENPFHSLLAGYIVVDDPQTGIVIKVPGNLTPDPSTGQITGVFTENPQFPFSELKLHFFGGARGELATPAGCGTYATTSDLMPWSAPGSGPDATPSDGFPISTGCVSAFAPSFSAGSTSPQAGGYSPFTLSFSRSDGDQDLSGLTVTLPPGLLGKIAGVPQCPDANANAGTCPDASQVGTVSVGAGSGPEPLFVGGKAYLTGPYKGGPYGLVVEVPAIAGPFNLGVVVVRQSLRIDPHTAQVTAVSDPFPTILQGIPLRVRSVNVTLDRPGFIFNPTSCASSAITGALSSTEGATVGVTARFQAGGCGELPFKPKFFASTAGMTSRADGASLHVKLVPPHQGPQAVGEEANIGKVKVELPKVLPSQLETLRKACTAQVFDADPANCPAGSVVGMAVARTPVLNGPLTGPAYFVSHGNEAFPQLVIVLQGENVTVELAGDTFINHLTGVTSSTFNQLPDVPVSSFELTLPQGKNAALAATAPLCDRQLVMPTEFVGQNGAVLKQSTPIEVTGCSAAIALISHSVGKGSVRVSVYVPAAGKVTVGGAGLGRVTKTATGRETLKLSVPRKQGGELATKLKVTFKPAKGKPQSKAVKLRFDK